MPSGAKQKNNNSKSKTISFYIMEYRKEYDRENLVGTEYEYLLHEDDYLYDEECVKQNNKIE